VRCKNRAEPLVHTQITIPETPASMSSPPSGAEHSRPSSAVSALNERASASPTTWFQSRFLDTNSRKVVKKRMRSTDILPASRGFPKEPGIRESNPGEPQTQTESEFRTSSETQVVPNKGATDLNAVAQIEYNSPLSNEFSEERLLTNVALDTFLGANQSDSRTNHSVLEKEVAAESNGAESLQSILLHTRQDHLPQTTGELKSAASRVGEGPVQPRYELENGQYTIKQLAGMALLAADGLCSASQVQRWVADNFPGYHRGEGGWEKSLQAKLAGKGEFRAVKRAGDKYRLYAFADATSRTEIENMFGDHPAVKAAKHTTKNAPTQADRVVAREVAVTAQLKHLPIVAQPELPRNVHLDETQITTEADLEVDKPFDTAKCIVKSPASVSSTPDTDPFSITDETVSHHIDGVFMPFERADRFRPINRPDPPNIRRESSFWKAFPELAKPSVDSMSDADIQDKIKEIKSRPSKKAAWGNRLAFARLHRDDVHDERASACKSGARCEQRDPRSMETQDAGERQSLKNIFDLPRNPIPILHNEQLAFRDGTLVGLSCSCRRRGSTNVC
jgi:hypothetical protein